MQAICVTPDRQLTVRHIPTPDAPPAGHVLVRIEAAAITHGDHYFLQSPMPGWNRAADGGIEVHGANAAGRIIAIGSGVPPEYEGRQVAIYKYLVPGRQSLGVWCEVAQLPFETCLLLPDTVEAKDYGASFANIFTSYAFLDRAVREGHKAVILTAGSSTTGLAAAEIARRRGVEAISLVRSPEARQSLLRLGLRTVLDTSQQSFAEALRALAGDLGATAVFDGVGGPLATQILPLLPPGSTIDLYGYMGGFEPISVPSVLILANALTIRGFSNLDTGLAKDPEARDTATRTIRGWMDAPLFRTETGRTFRFDQIEEAMAFQGQSNRKAVLVPA